MDTKEASNLGGCFPSRGHHLRQNFATEPDQAASPSAPLRVGEARHDLRHLAEGGKGDFDEAVAADQVIGAGVFAGAGLTGKGNDFLGHRGLCCGEALLMTA